MKIFINSLMPLILTLLLLVGSCSHDQLQSNNQNRAIANSDIEKIIDEFQSFYQSQISQARKDEIKIVQGNLLKYLIEASASSDADKIKTYKEANTYFNRVYPLILENLRNEKLGINTLVEIKKAPLWTLKEEIRYLNKMAEKLTDPPVKIDLIKGLSIISEMYKNLALNKEDKIKINGKYEAIAQKVMGDKFNLHPTFAELEALAEENVSEEKRILKVVNLVESKIAVHESKIRNVGTEMANSGHVDMNNKQIKMVVKFMDYYFHHIQSDVVKTIMSEFVTSGTKLTEEEVLKIVFQNTGPALGKVLQQIGKEKGISEKFSKLLEILESSGKVVPLHLVEEVVAKDIGGYEFRSIEKEVGTGTVAQVNKAKIWYGQKEVQIALRIKKPGIEQRCKEDIKILRKFVPDNEALFLEEGVEDLKIITTLINSVENFLNDEVDFEKAVERQKKAYEVYNRAVKISGNEKFDLLEMRVPEVYMPPKGKSNLHVQEFAAGGVKFHALDNNSTKKIVSQEMVRMWFEEVLFKSGFFNADLHQGNFRIVLIEENNKIKILLYDFGLSSTLTKEEQRAFLLVGAGAYLKSPKTLADGLMVSMNKGVDKNLRSKLIKDIQQEMKVNPDKLPEDWVVWCVQKNYFVSENLGAFARGSILIKQLPESIGEDQLFKDTIMKSAVSNLWKSVSDRNYNYPLTKIDMVKLGAIHIKNSCIDLIGRFFKKAQ
jgi:predicted unusual protein kinase regulating ubiquinone biosynthesis (AarF/ABC1/UbiB family)